VHRHALSSVYFLHRARACGFCFPNCAYLISNYYVSTLVKSDKQGGWLDDRHGLSPILYDTVPLFVHTGQLLCYYIFICSNVHWRLVYLVCHGFLYCFCILAESYETINHYLTNIRRSSFDKLYSKLYYMHDHSTRQQVSGNVHHKRVRRYYGKEILQYVGPVAWSCLSNKIKILPLHMFSYQVKSQLLAGYWLLCEIYSICDV